MQQASPIWKIACVGKDHLEYTRIAVKLEKTNFIFPNNVFINNVNATDCIANAVNANKTDNHSIWTTAL